MLKIWEVFPKLFALVLASHRTFKMEGTGHPFDHTLQVAQVAAFIAEDADVARLAGAAGLCHNADRLLQQQRKTSKADSESHVRATMILKEDTTTLIMNWLDCCGEFTASEKERIVGAVLLHSGPNVEGCDPVLDALQDGDRVVCSMPDTIMYAAQFWPLPPVDPQWLDTNPDPKVTSYGNPESVLRNLRCREEWLDEKSKFFVRLPKAKELMMGYVAFINGYIERIKTERVKIGLWPYPVELT